MKVRTGSRILDGMLDGGYENDVITTLYGPAGSGKTCLAMLCCCGVARVGKKILYVDTENSFSVERLQQIAPDYRKVLDKIMFLRPVNFNQQSEAVEQLRSLVNESVGLVVVDTIAMLYRIQMGQQDADIYGINSALGMQIAILNEIARTRNIPVLVTNQVYADFENKDAVKIVGGDILKYGSKCLIELQTTLSGNRRAILRKHRSISNEKSITFKIVETGILGAKEDVKK